MKTLRFLITMLMLAPLAVLGQFGGQNSDPGSVTGNVSLIWQSYAEDSLIGAQVPPEKSALNAWANLIYTKGNFSTGVRYEAYQNALLGYPGRFKGQGIAYRFARYRTDQYDVTIGNFYDQLGSGLIFRSYEERYLGVDNAMDGLRVVFRPVNGIQLKGIYGRQRLDFDSRLINGEGVVRAADAEVNFNQFKEDWASKKLQVTLGGSFVSRFQSGSQIEKDTLVLEVPENVAAYAGRANIYYGNWNLYAEYVRKINDPNADNDYIYHEGEGIFANLSYSKPGFGFNLNGKMVDNMSFRSDRDLLLFDAPINFIPAITKVHTYNLAATLYPYATVIDGETGFNVEVFKKFKRKDLPEGATGFGASMKRFYNAMVGKYGTNVTVNFAAANNIDTTGFSGVEGAVQGYRRNSLGFGDEKFVRDLNVEISRKFSKNFKAKYTFYYLEFNTTTTPVTVDFKGIVYANMHVVELNNRLAKHHSLRTELQTLFTEQDKGDWGTVLFEYSYSPHWFVSVMDQYNFGNENPDSRVHYLFGTVGYINGPHRLALGYGKRREGIFCVGGVCRAVPASNGFEITFTSSF
ncbi:MAG: DUF6029 family protein [Flavobacteriales bacterium]|nr:DUF6029 family protein [Flavobacteriales bacterium]